ncbi:hypothetical protein [Clostridium sp. AN503]|uniref:hypothetical protein n=1 Tax=Clostridium sp. AN503 TaxID=3160598 RepID=UPI003458167B
MYIELDTYITEFSKEDSSDDYWYDVGVIHASQLINKFSLDDWVELMIHIDEKNNMWKKRFVYCLGDCNSEEYVNIILKIIDTDDEELFVMCIDALNEMITEDNKGKILCHKNINAALKLISKSGVATKNVLERFVQR